MARIAIVESYPYEAFHGGDGAFLNGLRRHLVKQGHTVLSLITDIVRGRSNPGLSLHGPRTGRHSWKIRRSLAVSPNKFLSLSPRLYKQAIHRLLGIPPNAERQMDVSEISWGIDEVKRFGADMTILTFGMCQTTDRWRTELCAPVMALVGFIDCCELRIGQTNQRLASKAERLPSRAALKAATVVLFNNHSDLKAYEKCQAANNGAYIGMGFPANIQPILDNSRIMMFVGADQPANREGLEWFLTQVWPIISNEVGDACLHIFGSIGKGLRHHQQPRVVIRGVVEDLSLGYAQAGLVISPLLSGTNGIKTKVAEAIAHGRPVVTTSVGVDAGDPGFFGEAVEVCDDATGFASAVVRLITDSELIRSRQLAARRTYHERLTPQTAYHAVDSLLSPHNTKSD